MVFNKEAGLATGYGIALITTLLLVVLLSSGQASLNIHKAYGTQVHPIRPHRVAHEGGDILMGHPTPIHYMTGHPQTDEILTVLITAGSDPSGHYESYTIQYQAAPQTHPLNQTDRPATEES